MRERNHTHNYPLCSCISLAVGSVGQFKWKRTMIGEAGRGGERGGGERGILRTSYNGHSEKTVTFSFSMAFKPRLEFPIQLRSGRILTVMQNADGHLGRRNHSCLQNWV